MHADVLILGAGFGGLELSARLSAAFGDQLRIVLIDKNDSFVFGFYKFELLFGRMDLDEARFRYSDIVNPGVEFRQETIESIDPATRRVVTNAETYETDVLVVALGAEYDMSAPPGFADDGHEFYSIPGAMQLREMLPTFTSGKIIIGVLGEPFKCPPAPCEGAMLLDEWFTERGQRSDVEITVVSPWGIPIPVSQAASQAILDRFADRNIAFIGQQVVTALDPERHVALLRDGRELPYDLFLGIPLHRVPAVVQASGLAENGWIPVEKDNLATRFPDVYAIGDVTSAPVPKAGIFAESAGRAVAEHLIVKLRDSGTAKPYDGAGSCYIEFGDHKVARVDANFLTGPTPTAPYSPASLEGAQEKKDFATSRRALWFGR